MNYINFPLPISIQVGPVGVSCFSGETNELMNR